MWRITSDLTFWQTVMRSKNSAKVDSLLFTSNPQRPKREDLISLGVIQGMPGISRVVANGGYLGGHIVQWGFIAHRELQKYFIVSLVQRCLTFRPTLGELKRKLLIPPEVKDQSAEVLEKSLKLKRRLRKDKLERKLKIRRSWDDLRDRGILKSPKTTHALLFPTSQLLTTAITKQNLLAQLQQRKSVVNVMVLLHEDASTASMICPSVRPKIRYFEKISIA